MNLFILSCFTHTFFFSSFFFFLFLQKNCTFQHIPLRHELGGLCLTHKTMLTNCIPPPPHTHTHTINLLAHATNLILKANVWNMTAYWQQLNLQMVRSSNYNGFVDVCSLKKKNELISAGKTSHTCTHTHTYMHAHTQTHTHGNKDLNCLWYFSSGMCYTHKLHQKS